MTKIKCKFGGYCYETPIKGKKFCTKCRTELPKLKDKKKHEG